MQRIRSAVNTCSAELRPLRHQLRYTTLRSAILKWTAAGMLMYALLYTSFYIIVRNNYLFGLSENTSKLLMEQYTIDLMNCWHHSPNNGNTTITVQTETDLSFVTVDSIAHNGLTSPIRNGIQVNPRTVVMMHTHTSKHSNIVHNNNRTADKNNALRNLLNNHLDAGSCIATPHQDEPGSKDSVARRLRSVRSSKTRQKAAHKPGADNTQAFNITSGDYSMRCLPSFIIAGAMKCGTGELMKWLELHPNLAVGSGVNNKREVHYFTSPLHKHHTQSNNTVSAQDTAPSKDTALVEYASFFPEFTATEAMQQYTFEKSPDYIRDRAALHSIRQLMPSMRIIVLLRNPALRALSEFSHHCRHGRYVKFSKEVHIHGTVYRKNSVVRNDYGSGSSSGNATSVLTGVPKSSYKTLAYPCTAADAELYFTQFAVTTAGSTAGATSTSGTAVGIEAVAARVGERVGENNLTHTSSNNLSIGAGSVGARNNSNSSNVSGSGSKQHSVVPELEHGFYDQQMASLLEIFPASQVLVLLQEDMYRHTFHTLRQVEEFLQIPCFDYAEYAFIPSGNPGSQDDTSSDSSSADAEGADYTDDGFYDTSIAVNVGDSGGKGSKKREGKGKRKAGKGGEVNLKPPKRVPISYEEQLKHYKAELRQYLSSWHGAETSTTHLYYDSSPAFQQYLSSVYRTRNKQLSELLYAVHKIDAFSGVHLMDMGWDMQEG